MSCVCNFCNKSFTRKDSLNKHLKENRCEIFPTLSQYDIHEKILLLQKQISKLTINGDHNNYQSNNTNNINVVININPITQLNMKYIEPEEMKQLLKDYDKGERTPERLNLFISDYLQKMLCNKEHPENHAIKYVKKYPPTFESSVKDEALASVKVVKNLKDTCELLSDPMIKVLKQKLNECVKKYGDEFDDIDDFDETLKIIRKELAKPNIKKYLSSFLQNDILNNIEMKLDITKIKK
jgi:hypothetical protein